MPLNPQIPLSGVAIQPPVNPVTMLHNVMAVREDMAKMQEAERVRQEAAQIRDVYKRIGIAPEREAELLSSIAQINPLAAEEVRKQREAERIARERTEAYAVSAQADAQRALQGAVQEYAPYVSFIAKSMKDPASWKTGRTMLGVVAQAAQVRGFKDASALMNTVPTEYSDAAYQELSKTADILSQVANAGQRPGQFDRYAALYNQARTELGREPSVDEQIALWERLGSQTKASAPQAVHTVDEQGKPVIRYVTPKEGDVFPEQPKTGAGTKTPQELGELLDLGLMVPSMMSKFGGAYNEAIAAANDASKARTGKPYNGAKAQREYQAALRFVSSLNGPQMVRFMGLGESVVNTIDRVRALADQLDLSGITAANYVELEAALKVFGNTEKGQLVAQYLGATNTLKEEFANLVNGGYAPTEDAFKLANKQINENYGVKAMNASLSEVQRLINYRLTAFDTLTPKGISADNPILEGLGRQSIAPKPSGPAQYGVIDPRTGDWVEVKDEAAMNAAVAESRGAIKAAPKPAAEAAPTVATGRTPPKNPANGALWKAEDDGVTYKFDAATRKWIQVGG